MAELHSWFPTLIHKNTFQNFEELNSYFVKKVEALKVENSSVCTSWLCGTYNTHENYNLLEDQNVFDFVKSCEQEVELFAKNFGVSIKPKCVDAWINLASPGDYQEYHIHPRRHFSLVYYVQVNDSTGNIRFKNTNNSDNMFPLPVDEYNDASYDNCFYSPEEGMVLVFKSNLPHMVEKNKSNTNRISVAMNFLCV